MLDLGAPMEARRVFTDLLGAVLRQAGSIIGADTGRIWLATEGGGMQCVAGEAATEPGEAVFECWRSHTVLREKGVLFLPLPNREHEVFAVAELRGATDDAAERLSAISRDRCGAALPDLWAAGELCLAQERGARSP